MASLYGHKWTSSYGDDCDPDRVWQATLTEVSEDQIKRGMSELVRKGASWPPSAPEFRVLCTGGDEWQHKAVKAADKASEELLGVEHKIDPEARESHWDEINKIRRGMK